MAPRESVPVSNNFAPNPGKPASAAQRQALFAIPAAPASRQSIVKPPAEARVKTVKPDVAGIRGKPATPKGENPSAPKKGTPAAAPPTPAASAKKGADPAAPAKSNKVVRIDLHINPADASAQDDRFTLHSDDGKTYRQTKTVKDDKVPGDKLVTLEFTGLFEGCTYSLEIDPGKEGKPRYMFRGVPLSRLAS